MNGTVSVLNSDIGFDRGKEDDDSKDARCENKTRNQNCVTLTVNGNLGGFTRL